MPKNRPTGNRRRHKTDVLLTKQNDLCYYCDRALPWDHATLDHVVPLSRGGGNGLDNLVASCQWCNGMRAKLKHRAPDAFREWALKMVKRGTIGPTNWFDDKADKRLLKKLIYAEEQREAILVYSTEWRRSPK